MRVAVIGAANIDITAKPNDTFRPCDSNPGTISFTLGGVGRNIAENLTRLGLEVSFFTCLAEDFYAEMIRDDCRKLGIDLTYAKTSACSRSSMFLCVNNEEGELVAGISDMDVIKEISTDYLKEHEALLNSFDAVVFDTNLEAETIVWILEHLTVPLFADTVSTKKTEKLKEALHRARPRGSLTIKANHYEAGILCGKTIGTRVDAFQNSADFLNMGITRMVVTLGREGSVLMTQSEQFECSAHVHALVNTNGAGDAFFSGMLFASMMGYSEKELLAFGTAAACLTMESPLLVSEQLNEETIQNVVRKEILKCI